jgi:rod shape-determining protein MreC
MAIADIRQRPGVLLTGTLVLHVVIISTQVSAPSGRPLLSVVTFGLVGEAQRVAMAAVGGVQGAWGGYVALREVQAENARLHQQMQTLQVRLQEQRAMAERAESLRQLLELRERAGLDTAAAEVIAGPASTEFRTVTVDRGAREGLEADQAVISPAGVVGRVILPGPRAAIVQLLIDRNAAVGALIERSRVQGVVMGDGSESLQMRYVPETGDVQPGDLVVTSGIDGIYPKGFVIGVVAGLAETPGAFREITVRPAVDFSRLEEVLVVLTPPPARVLAASGQ